MNRVMAWDCSQDGCFNDVCRLRFSDLEDALPGRLGFSDVDGITEVNGRALLLEWKKPGTPLPQAQHIMYSKLTKSDVLAVFVVHGDASTRPMTVERLQCYWAGRPGAAYECDLDGLKQRITAWFNWARSAK